MPLSIADSFISLSSRPFVIAEMSGNHKQSLERALLLVDAAADAGAQAVKLQTFTPEGMTLNLDRDEFIISDQKSLWKGRTAFDLYSTAFTPREWHAPIMKRARERGLCCFSSPFDESAVDFLEELDVPAYKIASFECVDLPLIRKVARTGKPLIISTGMASLSEISEAVDAARSCGCEHLALLKCTSSYPSPPIDSNLRTIPSLRDLFQCEVGLSDHTPGIGVPITSIALGATIIEKHLTISRLDGAVDSAFSLEPSEFKTLVLEIERAWDSLGHVCFGATESEIVSRGRRRSLYIAADIKAGEVLTETNLRRIRPGLGLPPKYYEVLLGKRVNRDLRSGTPMSWEFIS